MDFSRLGITPGFRGLDTGCGPRQAYRHQGVHVVGVDLEHENLRKAHYMLAFMEQRGEGGGGSWGLVAADGVPSARPASRHGSLHVHSCLVPGEGRHAGNGQARVPGFCSNLDKTLFPRAQTEEECV